MNTAAPVRLDPDGRPYGWSFWCSGCPDPGTVYVREEVADPDDDHACAVMTAHARDVHSERVSKCSCHGEHT